MTSPLLANKSNQPITDLHDEEDKRWHREKTRREREQKGEGGMILAKAQTRIRKESTMGRHMRIS
jgi:hypothetical protein